MRLASATLFALLASTSISGAQSASEKAFAAMMADVNSSGFLTMDVANQSYDESSDILTAQDMVLSLTFNWKEAPSAKMGTATKTAKDETNSTASPSSSTDEEFDLDFSLTYTIPTATFEGMRLEGDGIAFKKSTYKQAHIKVSFETSDKETNSRSEIKSLGETITTNSYYPFLGTFNFDEKRPISSILDYIRPALMTSSVESLTDSGMEVRAFSANGQMIQNETYGPMTMTNLSGGRVDEIKIAYQKGEMAFDAPIAPGKADEKSNQTITYQVGETSYKGYDFGAIASLFDPQIPPVKDGHVALNSFEIKDIKAEGKDLFSLGIDSVSQQGFKLTKPESYLLPLFEEMLVNDQEPDDLSPQEQEKLIDAVFHLMRTFSIEKSEVTNGKFESILTSGDQKGQKIEAKLGSLLFANLSSNGLKEFSFNNVSASGPDQFSFSFDKAAITDLEFPDYANIKALSKTYLNGREASPEAMARAYPPSLTMGIRNLNIEEKGKAKVSAKEIMTGYRTNGLVVPTNIQIKAKDVILPRDLVSHPFAQALMAQLQMDALHLNQDLTASWDEKSESYIIKPLNIRLENIAQLAGAIGFGGIKKAYLNEPTKAEAAMATGTILPSSLTLSDLGGLQTLINLAGTMTGMGPDQLQSFAPVQIEAMLSAYTKPDFAKHVANQVKSFLVEPKSLHLALSPGAPVPVAQILGVVATSPQMLPDILNISVVANDQ
ncbi:MAG: hypothetical protein N4A65_05640 [Cohaesibacter sp.]|jgi:hypothetical protein|nr:hypothetical protein [Cohaesibacter sp.]